MKWLSYGLLAFLCLLLIGIGSASLVKAPRRSMLPYHEIQPNPLNLEARGDDSDLEFSDFDRIPDISYGPFGYRNSLDLYLPRNRLRAFPVILYIHGSDGDKGDRPASAAIPLLQRGYAVAQITYRPANLELKEGPRANREKRYDFPAQIEDSKAAVRFLRARAQEYRLDETRVGAMGHSLGGYLAALLCTTSDINIFNNGVHGEFSSAVQAACAWNGLTDLRTVAHEMDYHAACFANQWAFGSRDTFSVQYSKGNLRIAEQASPATYVSREDPPLLLLAGFNDTLVPPHQSNSLYIHLQNAGANSELWIVPGGDHDGPTIFNAQTRARAADFFDRHLSR